MPGLSSLSSEKILNDTKYHKSARALLSVMALSNKLAYLLAVNLELKDLEVVSHCMKEAGTVCDAMFPTLVQSTHEALEKAINARISARKFVMRHMNGDDVKAAVLMVDPFYPDLLPSNAIKEAFSSMPSIPLPVHHAQPSTSGYKGVSNSSV